MSQQDQLFSRQYVTPGMYYRDMLDTCASESGLHKMKPERLAIAMKVSKNAKGARKNG